MDAWVQLGIAFLALVVAVTGLTFNGLQFKQWNKELKARAELEISISIRGGKDGLLVVSPDTEIAECLIRFAITNQGDRAATTTLMNFVAPRFVQSLAWVETSGGALPDAGASAPAPDDEFVSEPGQRDQYRTDFLDYEVDRIGRRSIFEITVLMKVRIPSSNEIRVPVRGTASADEIPDDVSEYEKDLLLILKREAA